MLLQMVLFHSFFFFEGESISGVGKLSKKGQIGNTCGCGPHGLFQWLGFAVDSA